MSGKVPVSGPASTEGPPSSGTSGEAPPLFDATAAHQTRGSSVFSTMLSRPAFDEPVASRSHEHRLLPGTRAGSFVIERFVAAGGFGQVYAAKHATTGCPAAVKVLHRALEVHDRVVARFVREVEVLRRLQHPNIVEVLEVGTTEDGGPFYAMEYLEGASLSTVLAQQGSLSLGEALEILEPVCAALAAAHAAGIVHRDVKASNILLVDRAPSRLKLLDFGIAKLLDAPRDAASGLTSAGRLVGTLSIMAPEQILGAPIDERVDIYALGALLFRMVTGRQPFSSPDSFGFAQQHLEMAAPKPSDFARVSAELDAVVLRCLEKDPARRFPSVVELMSAVRRAAATRGEAAEPGLEMRAFGVGLHVGLHVEEHVDAMDESLSSDIGQILEIAEGALQRDGFTVLSANETEAFGVRRLPEIPTEAARTRERCRALVEALRAALAQRPGADPRVQVTVRMHADELIFSGDSEPEILGGTLTEVRMWPPEPHEASGG